MNDLEAFLSSIAANDETTTVYRFTTDKVVPTRCRARLTPNNRREIAVVEFTEHHADGGRNSLPVLWHKCGFTANVLEDYLTVECYVYDAAGTCFAADYNPTVKLSDDGRRMVINFDWMLAVNDENKQTIMREIARRFYAAR